VDNAAARTTGTRGASEEPGHGGDRRRPGWGGVCPGCRGRLVPSVTHTLRTVPVCEASAGGRAASPACPTGKVLGNGGTGAPTCSHRSGLGQEYTAVGSQVLSGL